MSSTGFKLLIDLENGHDWPGIHTPCWVCGEQATDWECCTECNHKLSVEYEQQLAADGEPND